MLKRRCVVDEKTGIAKIDESIDALIEGLALSIKSKEDSRKAREKQLASAVGSFVGGLTSDSSLTEEQKQATKKTKERESLASWAARKAKKASAQLENIGK